MNKLCCICGQKIVGWGNDPWPVNMDEDAECCDACNMTVVLQARLTMMAKKKKNNKEGYR